MLVLLDQEMVIVLFIYTAPRESRPFDVGYIRQSI